MTDLYFPVKAPTATELLAIRCIRYLEMGKVVDGLFRVAIYGSEVNAVCDKDVQVSEFYQDHLRCFLWRHHVYMELVGRKVELPPNLRPLLLRYILYMDGMVEGLLTTLRNPNHIGNRNFRSRLFNLYLIIDYHVGRHEYDVVGAWRESHPDIVLECVGMDEIGMSSH